MRRTAGLIASGLGCGRVPVGGGTVASIAATLAGAVIMRAGPLALPLAVLATSLGGLWAIRAARVDGDPGWVVIDEVAGQWIALLGLDRATPLGLITACVVFRLLDVTKPGLVGWADRGNGAAAIMADDLIAGALTAGVLWAVRTRWPVAFG